MSCQFSPQGCIRIPCIVSDRLAAAGIMRVQADLYEIHEVFAALPLLLMRRLSLCPSRVNLHGGAISLGHPLGTVSTTLAGFHGTHCAVIKLVGCCFTAVSYICRHVGSDDAAIFNSCPESAGPSLRLCSHLQRGGLCHGDRAGGSLIRSCLAAWAAFQSATVQDPALNGQKAFCISGRSSCPPYVLLRPKRMGIRSMELLARCFRC